MKWQILVSIGLVILNILIGHFFAPSGILLTPVILSVVAVIICILDKRLNAIVKSVLLGILISLHDIGIKLYSGGEHDFEGLDWINLMMIIGSVAAFGILITGILIDKKDGDKKKWAAIFFLPLILIIHFLLFENLGLGRYYWYQWNS